MSDKNSLAGWSDVIHRSAEQERERAAQPVTITLPRDQFELAMEAADLWGRVFEEGGMRQKVFKGLCGSLHEAYQEVLDFDTIRESSTGGARAAELETQRKR